MVNVITGTSDNDSLFDTEGTDSISGLDGNDLLGSYYGPDTLDGGNGIDTAYLYFYGVSSGVSFALSSNTTAGNKTLANIERLVVTGSVWNDSITGGDLSDQLSGDHGADTLDGAGGDDELHGGYDQNGDWLVGGFGDDSLDGAYGADTLDGGEGIDLAALDLRDAPGPVSFILGNDTIAGLKTVLGIERIKVETSGHGDTITGGALADEIRGNAGADILDGAGGNDYFFNLDDGAADHIFGGDGNDTLFGADAGDTLDGGAGIDYAYVYLQPSSGAVLVDLTTGAHAGTVDMVSIDQLSMWGGSGDDTITGAGYNDYFAGNDGSDILGGSGGSDSLWGGSGNDTLDGGEGGDFVHGGIDNDRLTGGAGNDSLQGNLGNDLIAPGSGDDEVLGGAGTDIVSYADASEAVTVTLQTTAWQATGGSGSDRLVEIEGLTGSAQGDQLSGNWLANLLAGGGGGDLLAGYGGSDTLDGGAGADVMQGGKGNDVYIVDDALDAVEEAADGGSDGVRAGINFTLGAFVENLVLTGGNINGTGNGLGNRLQGSSGNNHLYGLGGNDTLEGGSGLDTLAGGLGADLLDGGRGNDSMTGGAGADRFSFSTLLGNNIDAIADFVSGTDIVLLDHAIFAALAPGALAGGAFRVGTTAQDADDRIIYDPATGVLRYDADGNGTGGAWKFAILSDHAAIGAADFLIV